MSKAAVIGGGGVRIPLLVYGINEARDVTDLYLWDVDSDRAAVMAQLAEAVVQREGGDLRIHHAAKIEEAIEGADYVLNSIRVGGIKSRASDERIAFENGYPGQETTGPGGLAMALRTVPVAIEQAQLVERLSPQAWFINFTNPAGLITQAVSTHTGVKIVGICDTPSELFHNIAHAIGAPFNEVECEYFGLNHLGWIRRVMWRGKDHSAELLSSDSLLASLYATPLFEADLIRAIGLIPSEYLFFYYARRRAYANQVAAGATRGEEIARLNNQLFNELSRHLQSGDRSAALDAYIAYLNSRNASYMKIETSAGSAFSSAPVTAANPFTHATGYHRIAVEVMKGLSGQARRVVVNIANRGTIAGLADDDIVEVPCLIDSTGMKPDHVGELPETVRGLVFAVKAYERAAIDAAVNSRLSTACKALLLYPPVGEWQPAVDLLRNLIASDTQNLGYLR